MEERLAQAEQRIVELERKLDQLLKAEETEPLKDSAATVASREAVTAEASSETSDDAGLDKDNLVGDIRETHALLTAKELESAEFPGSWPMFGTDMRMKRSPPLRG